MVMEYRCKTLEQFVNDLIRFEKECERDGIKYKIESFVSSNPLIPNMIHYGIILETWR